ncbi:MAG: hypothetical protein JO112_02595 [Planctomycetes bacterium]|nr:hypothetical protein [Planctomycetota bacterium]
MAFTTLSCPYCNTQMTVPDQELTGQRLSCPRCSEPVPYQPLQDLPSQGEESSQPPELPPAPPAEPPLPGSNRRVALGMVTIMVLMAVGGLLLALHTVEERRARDHPTTAPAGLAPAHFYPPARLPALRYLPQGTNLAGGIQVAWALQTPAGREFLTRSPFLAEAAARLQNWTGLKLEDFEYIVLGSKIDEGLLNLYLVGETRRPVEEAKVRATLQNSPAANVGLRMPNDHTLILTFNKQDLDKVPSQPAQELALSPPLTTFLQERVGQAAQLWLAGHADRWDQSLAKVLLLKLPPKQRDLLTRVQTFGLWLELEDQVTLNAAFQCTDARTAQALSDLLSPANLNNIKLTKVQEGPWLTLQARGSPEAVLQALNRTAPPPAQH